MDPTRSTTGSGAGAGASGKQTTQDDSPEQLLDVFKAAALSVTKLYKKSAAAESRARNEGYQDCLDDLLTFLDKSNIGLDDGEGWRIRRWATERLDGRESRLQSVESDEEAEKTETTSTHDTSRPNDDAQPASAPAQLRNGSPSPEIVSVSEEADRFRVPVQENFTFQSSHPYPNIATLDLSDSRSQDTATVSSRPRARKAGPRGTTSLGRGAGSKRKMDFSDFFGGCLNGKDPFGQGGKRSRHI